MANVKLVTVIIPAYNAEATLERTLASALSQTHEHLEVFVVDDGSTDSTEKLANRFASKDSRVKVLKKENAGVASARNLALEQATGDYVAWLDADDLWHPQKIEKQLAVFETALEPLSFVYTGYRLIDPKDRILANFRPLTDISGHTLCRQIATNFFSNVSSIMVPLRLAQAAGGHDPGLRAMGMEGAEDLLLQLNLSIVGPAGCCKEALVGYRMHSENMSLDYKRAFRSNLKALEIIKRKAPLVPEWVFKFGQARVVGYVPNMFMLGDFSGAFGSFFRLFSGQPGYTLMTLAMIAKHQTRWKLNLSKLNDPEIGSSFLDAGPETAPWQEHMLLTIRHRKLLEAADARLAKGKLQWTEIERENGNCLKDKFA